MSVAIGTGVTVGHVTFRTFRTGELGQARGLIDTVTEELRERVCGAPGFIGARVHLGVDEMTVVVRCEWQDEAAFRALPDNRTDGQGLSRLASSPEVIEARSVGGTPREGIEGPDRDKTPGVVVVATRHVGDSHNALLLSDLLRRSGTWKRDLPGFIGAEPYISADGATFVNYPRWVDENAFHAYMNDPRNAEDQPDIAALEVADPEFVRCTVVADIAA